MSQVQSLLASLSHDTYAVDLEATGLDLWDPRTVVVGVALAGPEGCFYINVVNGVNPLVYHAVLQWLQTKRLVGFNIVYDGGLLYRDCGGKWLQWVMDVFGLYRSTVTDRNPKLFSWGLDSFESNILGWTEDHKSRLAELLAKHGLKKDSMARLAWLEPDEFGRYGAWDAEAAWQGYLYYSELVVRCWDHWGSNLTDHHRNEFLTLVRLLVEQNLAGITIDRARLLAYQAQLTAEAAAARTALTTHPSVIGWVDEITAAAIQKRAVGEPTKFTKAGTIQKRWTLWWEKQQQGVNSEDIVNWNSKAQLRDLFFRYLQFRPERFTEDGTAKVDKHVLPTLGDAGKLVHQYNRIVKTLGYVTAAVELSAGGVLHPEFKSIGCITGRLSGGRDGD